MAGADRMAIEEVVQHPPGQLLPVVSAAPQAVGAGAGVSGAGLRVRGLDAARRPAGGEPRAEDLEVRGQPDRGAARLSRPRPERPAQRQRLTPRPERQPASPPPIHAHPPAGRRKRCPARQPGEQAQAESDEHVMLCHRLLLRSDLATWRLSRRADGPGTAVPGPSEGDRTKSRSPSPPRLFLGPSSRRCYWNRTRRSVAHLGALLLRSKAGVMSARARTPSSAPRVARRADRRAGDRGR